VAAPYPAPGWWEIEFEVPPMLLAIADEVIE
jgi:hypothetical protein